MSFAPFCYINPETNQLPGRPLLACFLNDQTRKKSKTGTKTRYSNTKVTLDEEVAVILLNKFDGND
jgi:hypothetical protein